MVDYRSRRRRFRLRSGTGKLLLYNKLSRFAIFGVIGGFLLVIVLFLWYSRDLPTPEKLAKDNLTQSTRIMDRNGVVLYDVYQDQNRTYVELSGISKDLQEATIAIEDKDFYENEGFSITGYLRIIPNFFRFGRITGGSTITQQLVKNALLTSERTLPRKIKEFILASEITRRYSKEEILELYLNVAPYGGTAVGVEAASERYFGKKAKDLNLLESAILAGLPQRPSFYSPYSENETAYIARTKDVLRRMREDGYISKEEEEKAVEELPEVEFLPQQESDIKAAHFSIHVKNLLIDQFGEEVIERGGLRVTTTLDYELQKNAEEIVKEEVEKARTLGVGNGASVAINPKNGEILAMVGSRDFFAKEVRDSRGQDVEFEGQYNVITQGLRQPGSSIKPVTYATALERGFTAASLLMDVRTTFTQQGGQDYNPVNYDGRFRGPVQVRFALGNSLNIPAVKMLALVGVENMLETAERMGLETLSPTPENLRRFGLALTLGGGEVKPIDMAVSYSAFANGGYKVEPIAILEVEDNEGKKLFEQKETNRKRALSEEVAFIISHILLDNNSRAETFGTGSLLNVPGRQVAVKTGTTDDKRDNWTVGWTPSVLVLSWVGNNDNSPMGNVASGITGAAPIWNKVITEALKNIPSEQFRKPDNVIALTVDSFVGGLPFDNRPTRSEYFIKGTEPTTTSPMYKNKDGKTYVVLRENDPVSTDGKNRWQEGIDAWINENHKDDEFYHPPGSVFDEEKRREEEEKKEEPTHTPTPLPTQTPTQTPTPTP